jgi:hypothetical protein
MATSESEMIAIGLGLAEFRALNEQRSVDQPEDADLRFFLWTLKLLRQMISSTIGFD